MCRSPLALQRSWLAVTCQWRLCCVQPTADCSSPPYLRSTAAPWLTSLQAMACSITNSPTTLNFVLPSLPTTRREVSPFLPHSRRTLDCGTCRTDCSSTRTSRRHSSLEPTLSYTLSPLLCRRDVFEYRMLKIKAKARTFDIKAKANKLRGQDHGQLIGMDNKVYANRLKSFDIITKY